MHTDRAPLVTVVIVPRERFSAARDALDSVLEHTRVPHELVYVDGGAPRSLARHIDAQAGRHDFCVVRTPHFLTPNQAKNIGLDHVRTRYVVFIDNDVIVTPGWLDALLDCAEATAAAVVTPLVCEGRVLHSRIHCAGGDNYIGEQRRADGSLERRLVTRMNLQKRHLRDVRDTLERRETQLAENHCVLVRSDVFARIGRFDEGFLNTRDHIDFCLLVRQAGYTIWFEPGSVLTYVSDRPLEWCDLGFYMVRWSDAHERRTLLHMIDKWRLHGDGSLANRLDNVGWRREMAVWRPLSRWLTFGRGTRKLSRALFMADRRLLNRLLLARHEARLARSGAEPPRVRLSSRARAAAWTGPGPAAATGAAAA